MCIDVSEYMTYVMAVGIKQGFLKFFINLEIIFFCKIHTFGLIVQLHERIKDKSFLKNPPFENFQKTLNLHRLFQNGLFPAFFFISFCAKYQSNSNSILYFVFVIRTRGFDSKLIGSGTYLFDGTYKLRNSIRRRWRFEKEMRNNIFYF